MDKHLLMIADPDGDDDDKDESQDAAETVLCPNCGFKFWWVDVVKSEIKGMSYKVWSCLNCGYEESAYRE